MLFTSFVFLAFGCRARPSGTADPQNTAPPAWAPDTINPADPVVGRVGEVEIRGTDVQAKMKSEGLDRQTAFDRLLSFHLLAEKARTEGYWSGALLAAIPKELWVQRLLQRDIEPRLTAARIPDRDLRAVYDANIGRWSHPRLVEVALLAIYTGARMKPEARAQNRARAVELKAAVDMRRDRSPEDLFELAQQPEWKAKKVQFSRLWQGGDKPLARQVGEQIMRLTRPGDTTDLTEDETGCYIARYMSEVPPKNVSFAAATEEIRTGIFETWRREKFLQIARGLVAKHTVTVLPIGPQVPR